MRAAANKLTPLGVGVVIAATITLLLALVYAVNSNASQTGWRSAQADNTMHYSVATPAQSIRIPKLVPATTPAAAPAPVAVTISSSSVPYHVRAGDTLSSIAKRVYDSSKYWPVLYWANHIKNPNLITIGQNLKVPPRPLKIPAAPHISIPAPVLVAHVATQAPAPAQVSAPSQGSSGGLSGFLSYAGLEQLWVAAGGNPAYEATAACIAEHESGGNQYAHSPTNDFGYWQINGSHGALATYDAYGNARAAILISGNGTNWSPWTTAPMCGV